MAEKNGNPVSISMDLVEEIQREFPIEPLLPKSMHIAYAQGDSWSVQRINEKLSYRPWNQISFDEFVACGADELKSYLSPKALSYYMPGLMVGVLLNLSPRTRLHEVTTLMLMPSSPEFMDVWEFFGDGAFDDWGTPYFLESSKSLIENAKFIHETFSPSQRHCVARYIEIVEHEEVLNSNYSSSEVLQRFTNYWKS